MDAIFERFEQRDGFEGFGYIGGRRHLTDARRALADAMLQAHVEARGISEERLFTWANSRDGRFYADEWAGGDRYGRAADLLP